MAGFTTKGWNIALRAGDLDGAPDIRFGLAMGGFTCPVNAVNVDDVTALDEFDGSGYSRYDATGVDADWDDTLERFVIRCDSGDFGASVGAGSDDIGWLFAILNVDGTTANDIFLGATDEGVDGLQGTGGALNMSAPADGVLFDRPA